MMTMVAFMGLVGFILIGLYILSTVLDEVVFNDPELEKKDREHDERQKLIDAGKIGIARKIS